MSTKKRPMSQTKPAPRRAKPESATTKPPPKRRVLLVDDHSMTREGLAAIINRQADLEVIRLVLSGQSYVSPQMSARILDALTGKRPRGSTSPIEKLSDREFEVFRLPGNGRSTKEVAQALNLSPKTVDVHRGRIKEKLQFKDATSLIHHAVRWVETQAAQS